MVMTIAYSGFKVQGSGFKVPGFKVQGSGFRGSKFMGSALIEP
jgi:hypothetical protein